MNLACSGDTATFVLDERHNACLIQAGVWAEQIYAGTAPCLLVVCDTPYDPDDYLDAPP